MAVSIPNYPFIIIQLFLVFFLVQPHRSLVVLMLSVGGEDEGLKSRGSGVVTHQWSGVAEREKASGAAIDMFNKLAPTTAGVIVRAAPGSARHMVANRHDIAACLDLSIPSQWH